MGEQQGDFMVTWWAENLETLDREIARLATLCQVKILDRKVMRGVLQRDASVCGTPNPLAFVKLCDMLIMHFAVREKSVETVGQARTEAI
jgi:hypothetical protein